MDVKLGRWIPLLRDEFFRPTTNVYCPVLSCKRKLYLGDEICMGRNMVTFLDVLKIHRALGNRVGCHDGEAGECGLILWMQSR